MYPQVPGGSRQSRPPGDCLHWPGGHWGLRDYCESSA